MTAPTLYLVDASLYVFRAWHSMPDEFHDADGWPTNAVHGFARFLLELLERERPRHIAIAFDESLDSCFRNAIYPAYKANRDPAPPELRRQFAWCKALCKAVGLVTLAHTDYEADDLIGTAVHVGRRDGFRSVIVSADKDLSQLLQADDEQYDFAKAVRWKADGVKARHGVHAQQIADYLALTGDAVDNIPASPASARNRRRSCWRISSRWMPCWRASTRCRSCACAARRAWQRACANNASTRCCGASSPPSRWTRHCRRAASHVVAATARNWRRCRTGWASGR